MKNQIMVSIRNSESADMDIDSDTSPNLFGNLDMDSFGPKLLETCAHLTMVVLDQKLTPCRAQYRQQALQPIFPFISGLESSTFLSGLFDLTSSAALNFLFWEISNVQKSIK